MEAMPVAGFGMAMLLMLAYFIGMIVVIVLVVRALLRMATAQEAMVARLGDIERALQRREPPL